MQVDEFFVDVIESGSPDKTTVCSEFRTFKTVQVMNTSWLIERFCSVIDFNDHNTDHRVCICYHGWKKNTIHLQYSAEITYKINQNSALFMQNNSIGLFLCHLNVQNFKQFQVQPYWDWCYLPK